MDTLSRHPLRTGGLEVTRLPCVVNSYLVLVKDGEIPGVTELAHAREQTERDVGHHVKS